MQMRPEKELRLKSVMKISQSDADLIYLDLEGTILALAQMIWFEIQTSLRLEMSFRFESNLNQT